MGVAELSKKSISNSPSISKLKKVITQRKIAISRRLQLTFATCFLCMFLVPLFTEASTLPIKSVSLKSQSFHSRPEGDFETLVIPIKRAQNLLMIEATVDSVTGNFILDTGAPYLVLNRTYFRKGKSKESALAGGITGSMKLVTQTVVDKLEIQEMYFKSVQADLVNLGHIEDNKGVKILGLLGASLFDDLEMEIDVNKSVLYLYRLNKSGERISTTTGSVAIKPNIQVPIEVINSVIFVSARVGESKLRYCLDTGAEINVLSNEVPKKVFQHFRLTSRNALTGTSNQKVEVFGGELDELTIGTYTFVNSQTILTGLAGLQSVYSTELDGILGYNFLAEGRVVINYRKKQLSMYFYKSEKQ